MAYRCIYPKCKPMGCVDCNCAVEGAVMGEHTKVSEYMDIAQSVSDELHRVTQQRDELADALEGEYLRALRDLSNERYTAEGQKRLANMRYLIAKARGVDAETVQVEFEAKALAKVRANRAGGEG